MARQASSTEQTISYKGTADVRRITKQEWKAAGVEDQDTVEWNADNDFTVPRSALSDAAWAKIEKDSDLKLSETEKPKPEGDSSS